ncbi:hypothetical protein ACX0HA_06780 [Flavobacterium hauense]
MKKFFTLFFIAFALTLSAQPIAKKELIGKWKAISTGAIQKMEQSELKELKTMFANSTFSFLDNGKFLITLPEDKQGMEEMFANTLWIYDENTAVIKIGTQKDNFSIMAIKAVKSKGKFCFSLLESGIKLEVVKQ